MSEELKPCPFCGDKAWLFEDDEDKYSFVHCENCGPGGEPKTLQEAISHWNTRHIPEGYALVPVERIASALKTAQDAMFDAYERAQPVCCGNGCVGGCCGCPEPEWDEADQRIMAALDPIQRELTDVLATSAKSE